MGNCQASDAVAVLIEYPNGRLDRLYWAVAARQIMLQNPGYYVGVYVWAKPSSSPKKPGKKPKLKILPPSAILVPGHCYRLISFEDMLDNKKTSKANKLRGEITFLTMPRMMSTRSSHKEHILEKDKDDEDDSELESLAMSQKQTLSFARHWRPSLQSISETG